MGAFDAANMALQACCGSGNALIYDDTNMPSVMVYLPKMTYAQLGLGASTDTHPAFIINGVEVDGIWISKYENIIQNGRAYSLPGQLAKSNVTLANAKAACAAKGAGWHLMTRAEYAALALWSKANGTLPKGNNNNGKDISESVYQAIPAAWDGDGNITRTLTGSGPLDWSHNRAPGGVWDLNGDLWEWNAGVRVIYGELQILADNDAADTENDQDAGSLLWRAIDGTTGALITPDGSGTTANSLKLDWVNNTWQWICGSIASVQASGRLVAFESVTVDESVCAEAVLLLQALGLYKYDTAGSAYGNAGFAWKNGEPEGIPVGGGRFNSTTNAGAFFLSGYYAGSFQNQYFGFRSAYAVLPEA